MSDFGTILTISKKDKKSFSEKDTESLSSAIKNIIEKEDYFNATGEPFNYQFDETDENSSLYLRLSEHYFGSDEDENNEMLKFVKDTELDQATAVVEELSQTYTDLEYEVDVLEW